MKETMQGKPEALDKAGVSRRKFLTYAGAIAGAGIMMSTVSSCSKDDNDDDVVVNGDINVGTDDRGVLNYLYALEQLSAAFFVKVNSVFYAGATEYEKKYLSDVRDHNIMHREFLKNMLADKAIPELQFDFSQVDFTTRAAVLDGASKMKSLVISGYNGCLHLLSTPTTLTVCGKMVSVAARHFSFIQTLIDINSFSFNTDENGMDSYKTPVAVVAESAHYFKTKITVKDLPKK